MKDKYSLWVDICESSSFITTLLFIATFFLTAFVVIGTSSYTNVALTLVLLFVIKNYLKQSRLYWEIKRLEPEKQVVYCERFSTLQLNDLKDGLKERAVAAKREFIQRYVDKTWKDNVWAVGLSWTHQMIGDIEATALGIHPEQLCLKVNLKKEPSNSDNLPQMVNNIRVFYQVTGEATTHA